MILAAAASGGSGFTMIIILVAMIALMYFMMIRPQSKERKRMNEMLNAMDVGDAILTSSGFYGVVIEIAGEDVIVEFGNNKNCRIPMKKSAIIQVEKPGGYTAPEKVDKKAPKAVEEKVEETAEAVKETAENVKETAENVTENAADAAAETAKDIAEEVSDLAKETEKI
jgi:preprotein translocase subunit YajC